MQEGIVDADPFVVTHPSNDRDFVRFEVTLHPGTGGAGTLDHEPWLFDNPDEHLHPHQEEAIEVLDGEYAVEVQGTEHRLSDGESITVSEATPHRHWNPTNDPIRVAHEHHPARESAAQARALWTLAQRGDTDESGIPNLVQFAVIMRAYPGIVYPTAVPIPVQKVVYAVLAPIGRLLGYQASFRS